MTLERAIEILEAYQDFCTKINQGPYEFNEAIDTVVHWYKNIHKA